MTKIADLTDRLNQLAKRREDEGIYTDAMIASSAVTRIADLEAQLAEARKELAAFDRAINGPREIPGHGRPVIVRSRDAGVQYGKLDRYTENGTVYLKDARQMWSWVAAEGGTLLDCATHGVKGGKFSTKAESVIILGACAIIDCTEKAVATLESVEWE